MYETVVTICSDIPPDLHDLQLMYGYVSHVWLHRSLQAAV